MRVVVPMAALVVPEHTTTPTVKLTPMRRLKNPAAVSAAGIRNATKKPSPAVVNAAATRCAQPRSPAVAHAAVTRSATKRPSLAAVSAVETRSALLKSPQPRSHAAANAAKGLC